MCMCIYIYIYLINVIDWIQTQICQKVITQLFKIFLSKTDFCYHEVYVSVTWGNQELKGKEKGQYWGPKGFNWNTVYVIGFLPQDVFWKDSLNQFPDCWGKRQLCTGLSSYSHAWSPSHLCPCFEIIRLHSNPALMNGDLQINQHCQLGFPQD